MIDIKKLKRDCEGRWHDIYRDLCPVLHDALEKVGTSNHVACPFNCGAKNHFRFYPRSDTGACVCVCGTHVAQLDVVMKANGLELYEAAKLVFEHLYGTTSEPKAFDPNKAATEKAARQIKSQGYDRFIVNLLRGLAEEGQSVFDVPLSLNYLTSIGYDGDGTDINYHAELRHKSRDGAISHHPAVCFFIRDENDRGCSMQSHYLDPKRSPSYAFSSSDEYKRQVPYPSYLKPVSARVKLAPIGDDGVLGISEGVRSATAASYLVDVPVWATLNAHYQSVFIPPKECRELHVFYDKDRSKAGERAAQKLESTLKATRPDIRFEYREPPMDIPDGEKSIDWFDVYLREIALNQPNEYSGYQKA